MSAYGRTVEIRTLFSMLIALAMLFAPAAAGAQAMAAAPDHHQQMMDMGHCKSTPSSGDQKAPVKSCCMAMCMAVAVAPTEPAEVARQAPSPTYFAAPQFWRGLISKIATPPPRQA